MTIWKHEMKTQKLTVIIWSGAIGLLLAAALLVYPEMKEQMTDMDEMLSSMGNLSKAFGMDQLSFHTIMGYFVVECGNILGLGGAIFAALTGITALMKEERDKTAEFLFTHPVPRKKVITEKLLAVITAVVILNLVAGVFAIGSVLAIHETVDWKIFLLFLLASLLMQLEIACITFGISAFIGKAGLGIGIGVAALFYFLNIIANMTDQAEGLKYLTPFGYTNGSDIVNSETLAWKYILPGMVMMILGIVAAYAHYTKKDLKS